MCVSGKGVRGQMRRLLVDMYGSIWGHRCDMAYVQDGRHNGVPRIDILAACFPCCSLVGLNPCADILSIASFHQLIRTGGAFGAFIGTTKVFQVPFSSYERVNALGRRSKQPGIRDPDLVSIQFGRGADLAACLVRARLQHWSDGKLQARAGHIFIVL